MKCPACGFDTPDEQGWCDFCKEPFRKKKEPEAAAKAAEAPKPIPAQKKVELPPGVMEKLVIEKLAMGKQLPPGIPAEFAVLDQGEKIPELSGTYRKLAWFFLAMVLFLGFLAGVIGILRSKKQAARAAATPTAPTPLPGGPAQPFPPPGASPGSGD